MRSGTFWTRDVRNKRKAIPRVTGSNNLSLRETWNSSRWSEATIVFRLTRLYKVSIKILSHFQKCIEFTDLCKNRFDSLNPEIYPHLKIKSIFLQNSYLSFNVFWFISAQHNFCLNCFRAKLEVCSWWFMESTRRITAGTFPRVHHLNSFLKCGPCKVGESKFRNHKAEGKLKAASRLYRGRLMNAHAL